MALNFPASPAPGEVFTSEGATFIWNGTVWMAQAPAVIPWATPAEAIAGTRGDVAISPLTLAATIREFHDPARVGSWRIIGKTLECWGRIGGSSVRTVTYPKTFARNPTVSNGHMTTTDQGATTAFSHQYYSQSATGFTARVQFITTGSIGDSGAALDWHAIGEWDGVS